ncbi:MAG: DUF3846 domain-containing protein [bacterium]|nr:DUF3846 domain-containing protein [bacterium]
MDNDYIFKAFIVNTAEYDNGNRETSGEWLTFPTAKDEVSALFEKIGLPNNADHRQYFIDDYVCGNDDMKEILSMSANIDELNYLASRISELEDLEMTIFQAAIQREDIATITDAINLTYNTEYYNVISDMYSWENVGAYFASHQGFDISAIGDLADYIDYEAYGKDYADQHGGKLAEDVYIEDGCTEWTNAYNGMIENIPSEYIVTKDGENIQYDYNFDIQLQESMELAMEIDGYLRGYDNEYVSKYTHADEPPVYISNCLIDKCTLALKDMLTATNTTKGDALVDKICEFEQKYPCDKYMIYQLKNSGELRNYRYAPYSLLEKQGLAVNKNNYEQTYVHYLSEDATLEKLYTWFNTDIPQDFKGHSMSVSDIVVLQRNGEEKAYYCDSAGFVEAPEFLSEQTQQITPDDRMTGEQVKTPRGSFYVTEMTAEQMKAAGYGLHHMSDDGKYLIMGNGTRAFAVAAEQPESNLEADKPKEKQPDTITVLVVEPMQEPYVKKIPAGLEALQKEVGGTIAAVYPSEKPIALICNDEGKINGMQLNRALYDTEGEMYDIVAGTFLIVGLGEDNFSSLTPDLQRQFMNRFKEPEIFVRINGDIQAVHVKPSIRNALNKLKKEQDGRDKPEPQKKPPNKEI